MCVVGCFVVVGLLGGLNMLFVGGVCLLVRLLLLDFAFVISCGFAGYNSVAIYLLLFCCLCILLVFCCFV